MINVTKFLKTNSIAFIILSLVIGVVFSQLPRTFYQQDEWYSLGIIYAEGSQTIFDGVSSPLDFIFAKGRVLSSGIGFLFLNYFPFQITQLAIFAILLHIIATCLVYFLINKFFQNRLIALLGASFFTANAVSHGAVTWPVIAINTVTSTILILLSILFFFKYIDNLKLKWLFLTGVMTYFSLWFKETGTYLFLFLPMSALLFRKYTITSLLKRFWFYIFFSIMIISYRIILLKLVTINPNLYITGQNEHFFSTILLRVILYPLTSLDRKSVV